MVVAWYRDNSEETPEDDHHLQPPQYLQPEEVFKKSGVKLEQLPKSLYQDEASLTNFQFERGYNYSDFLVIDNEMPQEKLDSFLVEHFHCDPECRLILDGSGFFEVQDGEDRWIRLQVGSGDLLTLPPGIFHRLALDRGKYIKFFRLYTDSPVWKGIYRPDAEGHEARTKFFEYLKTLQ